MENLSTYLNDHLAGAAGALEHLDHMIKTCDDPQLAAFLSGLRLEIETDKGTLQKLMADLGIGESSVLQVGAWISEKLARVKLGPSGEMGLFLSLETLVLGITGKQKLWAALSTASENLPQLRGLAYANLEARAVAQASQVEAKRQELARVIFQGN